MSRGSVGTSLISVSPKTTSGAVQQKDSLCDFIEKYPMISKVMVIAGFIFAAAAVIACTCVVAASIVSGGAGFVIFPILLGSIGISSLTAVLYDIYYAIDKVAKKSFTIHNSQMEKASSSPISMFKALSQTPSAPPIDFMRPLYPQLQSL